MSVVHFSFASDGGASRAGRRADLACRAAGLTSSFAFVEGAARASDDVRVKPLRTSGGQRDALAKGLHEQIQWGVIPENRSSAGNTLVSIPYPGLDLSTNRLFEAAEIVHLHWPTWAASPRMIADWLARGKTVFWTLHDMWAMTGGCHYSAGCRQFETRCMRCPQMTDDFGLIGNAFDEKLAGYGEGGALFVLSPSQWLAGEASKSAILRSRPIDVVRNAIELDVFKPAVDRDALRAAFGIGRDDFALMMGSADLTERRKGAALLIEAVRAVVVDGSLSAVLPPGANIHLLLIGKNGAFDPPGDVRISNFGEIGSDGALADILALADVLAMPSLEDNYPNVILEALACGTPVIGFDAGGVREMFEDGRTGLLVRPAGSVEALSNAIVRFVRDHFRSEGMRSACRAHAERIGDPARIGEQLRDLYERALGRTLRSTEQALRRRMLSAFAEASAPEDVRLGPAMLRFPANYGLAARSPELRLRPVAPPTEKPAPAVSLLTVRSLHAHHSARSGPYQFLRHLPRERYAASHFTVPLNAGLATGMDHVYRKVGVLMGAPDFGRQGNAWLAEAEVLMECARRSPDLVHFIDGDISGMWSPAAPASLFRDGRRPAFVATFHQPVSALQAMLNPESIRRFDGVVALCKPQRDYLANFLSQERLAVIPHGVDVDFFRPAPVARPREGGSKLLLVGHWMRDFSSALRAFRMLKAFDPAIQLRIVSPTPPAEARDPSIVHLQALTDEQLREEYRQANLLFLPLIDATANNAILEAMACGLPVVSTRVGGVPEAVGADAGALCTPGSAEDLRDAAVRLLSNTELHTGASLAARRRAEQLAWPRIAEMHHEFYRRLL